MRMSKLALSTVGFALMMVLVTPSAVACIESTPGKVTGGGHIPLFRGQTTLPGGSFGFNVMYYPNRMDTPKGELQYVDHATGMKVHAHTMTGLEVYETWPPDKKATASTPWEAWFEGWCKVNGGEEEHFFWVHVVDYGEPGTIDVFEIIIWEGDSSTSEIYHVIGWPILVGNILVHKK